MVLVSSRNEHTISEVSRRALARDLLRPGQKWFGDLDEVAFLSRVFDLDGLPSTDGRFTNASGDIWQHRVNNPEDWADDWVFSDDRFGLLTGTDESFLRFLSETINPAVRGDQDVRRLVKVFDKQLENDGWEFFPVDEVSGRIRYAPRHRAVGPRPSTLILDSRKAGVQGFDLGESVDETRQRKLYSRAKAALQGRQKTVALKLLESVDFALCKGTNSFADYFLVANALVAPDIYAKYQQSAERPNSAVKTAAAELRAALEAARVEEPEIRFVVITLSENIVRGAFDTYSFEDESFDSGGFATIHRARSSTRSDLALKRLHAHDDEAKARLQREIQEQSRIQHPAVMPIIDHDPSFEWFVMPLADENLAARWVAGPIDDLALLEILRSAAAGLSAAHALRLVHRDVSPRNVLRVGGQWVVADWGVVRRPPGLTTMVRTQGELGSTGFAAPELFRTAHQAGAAADIYALGRLAAWAVTREWPEQNVPLLPAGPWRHFVRRTTEHEAARRPQTMEEVLKLLASVEDEIRRASGPQTADTGSDADDNSVLEACLAHPDEAERYLDRLHGVEDSTLARWVESRPNDVGLLVEGLEGHLLDSAAWGVRDFDSVGPRIAWLRRVAKLALARENDGLLEDVVGSLLRADAHWQRFQQRHATREWIEGAKGTAAATIARVLAREHAALEWLLAEGWFPDKGDAAIRAVFKATSLR